uniref:Protein Wnt n=1 Tax=Echeneis naucrates TaxID=173247 RepID=A0A665V687_ECHNA
MPLGNSVLSCLTCAYSRGTLSPRLRCGGQSWQALQPQRETYICRKAKRLAGKQAELCQTQPEIVSEVAKGARLGVRECQYQFRYRRWNCTSHNKYFDIRETAFVYAITAAGVTHAVTQACLLDVGRPKATWKERGVVELNSF